MIRFLLVMIVATLVAACGEHRMSPQVTAPTKVTAEPCAQASCSKDLTLQVIAWDAKTLSPSLLQQINEIGKSESNATYAFSPGAVSRDLHSLLMDEWQRTKGGARGIRVPVSGMVYGHPAGPERFTMTPGKSGTNPELTYYTWVLSAQKVRDFPDPQWSIQMATPKGCQMVYPQPERRGVLSTRSRKDSGENELHAFIDRNKDKVLMPRATMHYVFRCGGGRDEVMPTS